MTITNNGINHPFFYQTVSDPHSRETTKHENKALASLKKCIHYFSSFSLLQKTPKEDKQYLNLMKGKHIVIEGKKEFKKQVEQDIKTLLTTEIGRELFLRIENQKRQILISFDQDRAASWMGQEPESEIYINLQNKNDTAKEEFFTLNQQNHQFELITTPHPSYIALAHELCHIVNGFDHYIYRTLKAHSDLYPHLDEEVTITGNGDQEYIKFNENEFRKAFGLPLRIAHLGFSKKSQASPLHYACLLGSLDSIQELLDHGQEVNSVDLEQRTPLWYATTSPFLSQDPEKFKKTINMLIAHGGKVDKMIVCGSVTSKINGINKEYFLKIAKALNVIDEEEFVLATQLIDAIEDKKPDQVCLLTTQLIMNMNRIKK